MMDLSKPDTLCVYCGSNLEKVTAEELTKVIMVKYLDEGFARVDFRENECFMAATAILAKYSVTRK